MFAALSAASHLSSSGGVTTGSKSEEGAILGGMNTVLRTTDGAPVLSLVAVSTPGETREPFKSVPIQDTILVTARCTGASRAVPRFMVVFIRTADEAAKGMRGVWIPHFES